MTEALKETGIPVQGDSHRGHDQTGAVRKQ